MKLPLFSLALPFALLGCTSMARISSDGDESVLAERTEADGARVVYRLRASDDGDAPKLIRDRHTTVKKIRLQLAVADINKDRAARLGVEAWKGVYVERVNDDSSLAKAGLVRGDVLLSANGVAFSNARQFNETATDQLAGATQLELAVLRSDGEDKRSWTPLNLTAAADTREVRDTVRNTTELERAKAIEAHTGMQVAELNAATASEALGIAEPTLVVADVRPGSPAYLAGIRARDRIVQLDGQPVTSIAAADAAVKTRIGDGASLLVAVDGPLGSLTTPVAVLPRLDDETELTIPILWCYERDLERLEWGCLQFIFQFGGTYERRYVDSPDRAIAYRSSLSLFPLGLFELDEDADEKELEILWFISHRWSKR